MASPKKRLGGPSSSFLTTASNSRLWTYRMDSTKLGGTFEPRRAYKSRDPRYPRAPEPQLLFSYNRFSSIISPTSTKKTLGNVIDSHASSCPHQVWRNDANRPLAFAQIFRRLSEEGKLNQVVVTSKSVEDGLEDIDGGWEGYMETEMPEKGERKLFRNLRHHILNVYRRLFSIVFLVNMGVLISIAVRGATADYIGKVVIANIFVSVLIREEHIVNGLFFMFTAVPKSWPLWMRVFTARVYSLGGIHSGSAVAALMWLIYFTVQVSIDLRRHKASIPLAVITYVILAFLVIIISLAAPAWRRIHHDKFEMVHRFLGWTVTGLVWAQVILLIRDYKDPSVPLHVAMRHSAPFWLVVILTASIASSWTHLRKVKVQSEVLSNHAVRIHYDYTSAIPGTFSRVSYSPLTEWHSFATISIPGQKGFDHIISRVGDWTSKTIANPPEEIWIRGVPTAGIMNVVPLFNRVVVVATGSGIAPCAPHVFAKKTAIKLLWTSRNIRKTYGDRLVDSIMTAAPDAIIYDTDAHGKPDMVKLIHHVYKEFNAEAVCIISNQPLTQKVVYGLMARGVPAFGAIWDS